MLHLHKYWLREFIKFFFIIQLMILVLFILIEYLSKVDNFINADFSLIRGVGYVLLKVPFIFVQLTPACILLASVTIFSLMNKNNELLAVQSSGISPYCLIRPALMAGAALAVLMLFLGETIIPFTMAKANYLKYNLIRKHPVFASKIKDVWIKSENKLIHINFFDPAKQSIAGITITSLGKNFDLISRVDARKATYQDGAWILKGVIEQIHAEDSSYDVNLYDEKRITLALNPDDLGKMAKKSEEMSFFELKRYVNKIEEEGYDARTYKVDLHAKIAFPFICVIMVLTGAATGMRSFAKQNIPASIVIGVIIAFLYWTMYGFCLSLGYGNILPPLISAWITNIFFVCSGVLYLVNME